MGCDGSWVEGPVASFPLLLFLVGLVVFLEAFCDGFLGAICEG